MGPCDIIFFFSLFCGVTDGFYRCIVSGAKGECCLWCVFLVLVCGNGVYLFLFFFRFRIGGRTNKDCHMDLTHRFGNIFYGPGAPQVLFS